MWRAGAGGAGGAGEIAGSPLRKLDIVCVIFGSSGSGVSK